MADYSNITVVAVLDSNGELHKINYEQLANLPSSMKNPHALIIFGQRYDGSNEVTITPTIATTSSVGCVKPVAKTSDMTQDVGIDASGKLYTNGFTVDQVVTAFSSNPVSSDGVRNYVMNNTTQINQTIQQTKNDIKQESDKKYNELRSELTTTESAIDDLKTSVNSDIGAVKSSIEDTNKQVSTNKSDIDALKTSNNNLSSRVQTNEQNINYNKQDIADIKPKVTQLQSDLKEVKSRNIGYYFDSEFDLLAWLRNTSNTALLGVGVCLYITGNTSIHYIWNGTSADRVVMISDVVGGYMTAQNPTGTGYITMNNNQVASDSAAFGRDNVAQDLYSFVSGHGIETSNEAQAAVGRYNALSKDDEIFTVGYGSDNEHRKTVHYVSSSGTAHQIGDVTAYDESLDSPMSVDVSKARTIYTVSNIPDNVKPVVDWDTFISAVTLNSDAEYAFVYNDGHWSSTSYEFSYVSDQQTQYKPIGIIGITFDYKDGRISEVPIEFADGDTITVYAPLQKTISLRNLYNTVNSLRLYIDEDGDVCQED